MEPNPCDTCDLIELRPMPEQPADHEGDDVKYLKEGITVIGILLTGFLAFNTLQSDVAALKKTSEAQATLIAKVVDAQHADDLGDVKTESRLGVVEGRVDKLPGLIKDLSNMISGRRPGAPKTAEPPQPPDKPDDIGKQIQRVREDLRRYREQRERAEEERREERARDHARRDDQSTDTETAHTPGAP